METKLSRVKIKNTTVVLLLIFLGLNLNLRAQNTRDVNIKVHLNGVHSSKITLMPMSGAGALKPLIEKNGILNNETVVLSVPKDKLPGQFVLRFDYKEKESSNPYPSEKYIFINNQDLELWVKPKSANNQDSTYFQKGRKKILFF